MVNGGGGRISVNNEVDESAARRDRFVFRVKAMGSEADGGARGEVCRPLTMWMGYDNISSSETATISNGRPGAREMMRVTSTGRGSGDVVPVELVDPEACSLSCRACVPAQPAQPSKSRHSTRILS